MKRHAGRLSALDFAHPQQALQHSSGWRGWSVLAIALTATTWLAFDLADLKSRHQRMQAASLETPTAVRPLPATLPAEMRFADESLRSGTIPWDSIFSDLEAARKPGITLLHVHAQGRAQTLRIGGEAQSFNVLTAFLADLDKRPGLAGSQLLGHQLDEQRHSVKFEARVQWTAQ